MSPARLALRPRPPSIRSPVLAGFLIMALAPAITIGVGSLLVGYSTWRRFARSL